jgi:hypothetical protein
MNEKTNKFKLNDIVRVLPGVEDPDFKRNLAGWTGKIEEIDLCDSGAWIYAIRWDRPTLSKAGDDYIDQCEHANLDYEIMYLEEKELEIFDYSGSRKDDFFLA